MSRGAERRVEGSVADLAIFNSRKVPSSGTIKPDDPLQPDSRFPSTESNILKGYASYSYRWVLAALTPEQAESGSYKQSDSNLTPGSMVIGEGGYTGPTVTTGPRRPDNLRSSTFYGVPEFYINNVEIKIIAGLIAAAGGSGNFSCKFEVTEPHSLGLFLQSIQAAAQRVGFGLNYVQCPFMLRCDFLGWKLSDADLAVGNSLPTASSLIASRHFVINIREIKFTASEAGSVYQVDAIHKDNLAYANTADSPITAATSVSGKTIREILKQGPRSLQTVLNDARKQLANKALDGNPDEYEIEFAEDLFGADKFNTSSAQGKIGDSKFSSSMADPPSVSPGSESADTETSARDRRNQPQAGQGAFQFNSGQTVTDMIKEIMLHSEYCHKALTKEGINSDTGMVNWFRISATVNFKEEADAVKYRLKKVIRYIVTPYTIHSSLFKHPSAPALGLDKIRTLIKRKYDYLFTGKNDDIIKWELKFDGTWYKAMDPSGPEGTDANDPSRSAAMDPVVARRIAIGLGSANSPLADQTGRIVNSYRLEFDRKHHTMENPVGGAFADNAAVKSARQFQKAALESKDLARIQMEIVGDPYYMAESGTVDISMVPLADNPYISAAGIMTSETTEIRTFVAFKTPIDVPAVGSLYEFPQNGDSYSPFSGLYRVVIVTHMFKDGLFTQILDMIRDRDQPLTTEIKKSITDSNLNFYDDSRTIDKATANSTVTISPVKENDPIIERSLEPYQPNMGNAPD
jgi:hypothetical protein